MSKITELRTNVEQRRSRIAELDLVPDDNLAEADKLIPDASKQSVLNSIGRLEQLLKKAALPK